MAILDDRKSLLIAWLAISDQNATFIFIFFKMPAGGHFGSPIWAILDDRKSPLITFLAISDQYTTFFFEFFFKIAAGGHFGSPICAKNNRALPIDAKNHKVLVIWDLNGYGGYEFDWCICDKVMACTSVGVRRRRRRRNQKHNTPEIFKFWGYNYVTLKSSKILR